MTDMERHDAICALLDLDPKIIEHKAAADANKLNADHTDYDKAYEFTYFTTLLNLRRAAANNILGPNLSK